MRVSLNWIKRLLDRHELGLSVAQLHQQLTLRVAEFEGELEVAGPALGGVVVGKVLTCAPHPNADKLRCTTVEAGGPAPLRIVCGAPNVAAGQTVAVATIGATLSMPGKEPGTTQSITIKPAKLRGEPSEGMICAEDELGLGTGHDGILVLDGTLKPGTPLREALGLGDTVLVIENHAITHRPDLWGQLGWAREIAAICDLRPPQEPSVEWQPLGQDWSAEIRDDGCTAYAGAVVEGVSNAPSPSWMQDLLASVGVRPLGLLVDVTNYVMLELGEPMHAFDLRELAGNRVTVRAAAEGEEFTTLDGKQHRLAATDLVIADERRALALAGIMGGAGSAVRDDTTGVLLEAAIFRPERIRRTRKRVGIATDSSARFEKGLYPELAPAAIARACQLLVELCPGARVVRRFASGQLAGAARTIDFAPEQVRRLTGIDIPAAQQGHLLRRLGFAVEGARVTVPWWRRKDVSGPADLVEEVARTHGYHHIAPETPRLPAAAPAVNLLRATEHRARRQMSALGWDEVATYAFTSEAWAEALGWSSGLIRLAHPLSSEQTVLRQSLLPNLVQAVAANRKHRERVAIYEVGKRYGDDQAGEEVQLAGACTAAGDQTPFYAARDAALALLRGLGYDARFAVRAEPHAELAAGRAADVLVGTLPVGICGELPKALRERAGCPERVGWFSVRLQHLVAQLGEPRPVAYRAPSRFPVVERQFTWDCPEELPFLALETPMRQAAGELCAGIALDSIYRGEQLAPGRKAVSMRILLQSGERTLEEQDLLKLQGRIIASVENRTPAKLRK
jgi:phenylalanyl-tRNA synthetase beta chain